MSLHTDNHKWNDSDIKRIFVDSEKVYFFFNQSVDEFAINNKELEVILRSKGFKIVEIIDDDLNLTDEEWNLKKADFK